MYGLDGYKNKVIVITGATGSLGHELCIEFAKKGARLAICSLSSHDKLRKLSDEIAQSGGQAIYKTVDVSILKEVQNFIRLVLKKYHTIDVLVNNAGIANAGNFCDLDPKLVENEMRINYLGPFYLMKEILPLMLKNHSGQIINISSIIYFRPFPFLSTYSASKAALSALTDSLRSEISDRGIDIIHVCMGKLKTGISSKVEQMGGGNIKSATKGGMDPQCAAMKIISCSEKGKKIIFTHFGSRLIILLNFLFPYIFDKLLYRAKVK